MMIGPCTTFVQATAQRAGLWNARTPVYTHEETIIISVGNIDCSSSKIEGEPHPLEVEIMYFIALGSQDLEISRLEGG
ncbi:uncharacterized protein ARMOST_06336 [Armillaria ostoyae]|uniref:Uncharacterized protein n=1 Tax=Armillaria ostoyae TaxID=47428 RepID=A0A284R2P3_ARMOS|nr:uncharacterized protein ARMOST_06336 [Armillaria ostoyae]